MVLAAVAHHALLLGAPERSTAPPGGEGVDVGILVRQW